MRFMVMVKANKNTEAGVMPDEQMLTAMGNYNESLVKAGIMLAGDAHVNCCSIERPRARPSSADASPV